MCVPVSEVGALYQRRKLGEALDPLAPLATPRPSGRGHSLDYHEAPADAPSRPGIIPGYSGHVPQVLDHFGSTHVGGTQHVLQAAFQPKVVVRDDLPLETRPPKLQTPTPNPLKLSPRDDESSAPLTGKELKRLPRPTHNRHEAKTRHNRLLEPLPSSHSPRFGDPRDPRVDPRLMFGEPSSSQRRPGPPALAKLQQQSTTSPSPRTMTVNPSSARP